MQRYRAVPVAIALAGLVAVLVGVFQGLVHVAPGYEGTITTGWDGGLNHEEQLLAALGGVGVAGAALSLRWKRLAAVPAAVGGVVLFYAVRAMAGYVLNGLPLYTETTLPRSTEPVVYVFGAEPFLLVAGGLLFVGAGIARLRRWTPREPDAEGTTGRVGAS